jgi:hypothetical protein
MSNRRGGHLRLVRSLRNEGTLLWGKRGERPVTYAIDLYSQGEMLSGNGDVRGDLAILVGRAPADFRLRLADGTEVSVTLADVEPDSATIEILKSMPPLGAQ